MKPLAIVDNEVSIGKTCPLVRENKVRIKCFALKNLINISVY